MTDYTRHVSYSHIETGAITGLKRIVLTNAIQQMMADRQLVKQHLQNGGLLSDLEKDFGMKFGRFV